ncbi:Homoserine/homoserine lactone efflux protein [Vibrio stylophorae]|uniref:Homoserine/homoserine lactone efflux protein n=1 Tax=Vibrio stylophorae TaxID=659351 RepID=A0ABM8ZWJ8_9VIBR|nr:homoserine/homoserine lactone efflux protein [Vibrio stylophorae]CAH0534717.1 Homoserine/homoserine lactone efflux protein [Vibrio stylophorae]
MTLELWFGYLVTAILFSLSPGSGAVNSMANGLNYGFRRSLASVAGLQLGLSVHIILAGVGLGTLVAQSATAFTVIKWLGVAYLLWLGVMQWRQSSDTSKLTLRAQVSAGQLFRQALVVNLTNPKTVVFLVALFPQFLRPEAAQAPQLLILGVTTVLVDACVMLFYITLAAKLSRYLKSARVMQRLNRLFGSLFVGCGVLLAQART